MYFVNFSAQFATRCCWSNVYGSRILWAWVGNRSYWRFCSQGKSKKDWANRHRWVNTNLLTLISNVSITAYSVEVKFWKAVCSTRERLVHSLVQWIGKPFDEIRGLKCFQFTSHTGTCLHSRRIICHGIHNTSTIYSWYCMFSRK